MSRPCKCEHWESCPKCFPQWFDTEGNRLPNRPTELERLRKIEAAARNLVAVKGRHHSEQAYKQLVEVLR